MNLWHFMAQNRMEVLDLTLEHLWLVGISILIAVAVGVPLGIQPDIEYAVSPLISLSGGDIVLLLTDGIEEAMSPDNAFFGVDQVLDVVRAHSKRTAGEIVEAIYRAVGEFSHGLPQLDDLTVVVVKVKPSG